MNIVNKKILSDLEINNKVIPNINFTITTYGKNKFSELFNIMYYSKETLMRRKQIIQSIITNQINMNKIITELKKIKKYENDVIWLFNSIEKGHKDLYFSNDIFNTQDLLSIKNFLKTYTPGLVILVYLIIYIVMRYSGINIDIKTYFLNIYESYKMVISGLLVLFLENIKFISLLTNILATSYILFQLYSMYNSFDSSITHYNKCSDFNKHIQNIRYLINSIKKIYKLDTFFIYEKQLLLNNIKICSDVFHNDKLFKLGYKLLQKKNSNNYEKSFNNILQYVGLIDAFINISKLVTINGYTFPEYDFTKNKPYITASNVWSPYINRFDQIYNDENIGTPNNIILTGPNSSGKTLYLRNAMLSVFLAQTLGVTCCNNLKFTPFNYLFTYLDIPNVSNKESLFESEILRCMEYSDILEKLNQNEYSFTIMDELLTATNPLESMATSYAFCEFIGSFNNSLNIIATHHNELTDLANKYPNDFKNMKFAIIKNEDGTFYRSYKISDGISNQRMAIELLKEKGYNNVIIDKAIDKITNLN